MSRNDLADFLRHRREAIRVDQVPATAVHPPGRRSRRTPGLRREEIAALAGMSVSYYERLEQARAPRPSPQVLAALGTALRLTAPEREHLARLAGQLPPGTDADRGPVPDEARRLLDGLGPIPAYLVDGRQDIRAWNAAKLAAAGSTLFRAGSAEGTSRSGADQSPVGVTAMLPALSHA